MTADEAREKAKVTLADVWNLLTEFWNQSWRTVALLGAIIGGTWYTVGDPAYRAYAGDIAVEALKDALGKDCINNPTMPGYNPHSLACQKEEEIAAENAQTMAIRELNARFDAYIETQAEAEIKRTQETGQIIRLLEGLQAQ